MDICIKKIIVGPVRTNCYVVYRKENKNAVIVDPGDDAFEIERLITVNNLKPQAILLTHGHCDHIMAVSSLRDRYGIKVYIHEEEKKILDSWYNLSQMIAGEKVSLKADVYCKDNQVINLGDMSFKLIYTPGHTIGSCCYYMEDDKVLFSGDTLFYHSHGRTDFPTGSQSSIIRSITEKLLKLPDDVTVYPGHEEETTIGGEKTIYDIY